MKRIYFLTVFLLISNLITAQNKTDRQGRRQGQWIEYHDNGKVKSKGDFKNGLPVGEFLYYSESGRLQAKNVFAENGMDVVTEIYSEKGKVVATGFYKNKKRDGEWRYFDENEDVMILVENYSFGVLNGHWVSYYRTGEPQFEGEYKDGIKIGKWVTYDPEGNVISIDNHEVENYNAPELEGVELKE